MIRASSETSNEGLTRILLRTLGRLGLGVRELLPGELSSTPLQTPARVIPGRRIICGDCGPAELLDDGSCATCGGQAWTNLRHVTLPWDRKSPQRGRDETSSSLPRSEHSNVLPFQVLQKLQVERAASQA